MNGTGAWPKESPWSSPAIRVRVRIRDPRVRVRVRTCEDQPLWRNPQPRIAEGPIDSECGHTPIRMEHAGKLPICAP